MEAKNRIANSDVNLEFWDQKVKTVRFSREKSEFNFDLAFLIFVSEFGVFILIFFFLLLLTFSQNSERKSHNTFSIELHW